MISHVANEMYLRAEPCTTCGQPVVHVEIYRTGLGPHYGRLGAEYFQHADHQIAGDKVDDDCNYPPERLP